MRTAEDDLTQEDLGELHVWLGEMFDDLSTCDDEQKNRTRLFEILFVGYEAAVARVHRLESATRLLLTFADTEAAKAMTEGYTLELVPMFTRIDSVTYDEARAAARLALEKT